MKLFFKTFFLLFNRCLKSYLEDSHKKCGNVYVQIFAAIRNNKVLKLRVFFFLSLLDQRDIVCNVNKFLYPTGLNGTSLFAGI